MKQGIQGICLDTLLLQVCAAARHLVCRRTCAGVRARVCVCVCVCVLVVVCVWAYVCDDETCENEFGRTCTFMCWCA